MNADRILCDFVEWSLSSGGVGGEWLDMESDQ
jgi:hypothetical protein